MILDTISAIEITEPQTKIEEKDNTGILRDNFSSETHPSETGLEGGARGARLPPPLSKTTSAVIRNLTVLSSTSDTMNSISNHFWHRWRHKYVVNLCATQRTSKLNINSQKLCCASL